MFRDPLYRQIRRRLRELSDGNAFEICANDLLQKIYPSIAPREGGDDAGLDGVIAKEGKGSIQLICTTGQDVIGNLSRSIESNLKKGGKSNACILATSQRLTNSEKRKLEGRANQLGRPLMQIYGQAGMAQLLYREPRWLKELLGLTGDPQSLSVFPITSRPLIDTAPVGRADDLAKILGAESDSVVVGQPGSGKTHLLFTAAKKAKGQFVVDEDLTRIANAVRSLQPRFLIIDDAHSRLELLKRLKHVRQQIAADFRIVASCWPEQEEGICVALQIPREKCHVLDGLPQKQIKEVVQSQRIFGPPELVAEIIHQSQGKPGLAVTLFRLCWEAGTRDVVLGTALARDIRQSFEPLLGREAIFALGCFSLGGSAGMTIEIVAEMVHRSTFEVKRLAEQLAAAGVLDVGGENKISVHPFRLRQALVRDVILKPPTLDLAPLLAKAPDLAATTRVLIQAKAIGGDVPDSLLRESLQQLASYETEAFSDYAHLGHGEGEWVLDKFPSKVKAVAPVTLQTRAERTVLMLLDAALAEQQTRAGPDRYRRLQDELPEIKRWVLSAKPGESDAVERREILAATLVKWYATNKEPLVSIAAAMLVLSLEYEDHSSPPGEPMVVTLHRGLVGQNQLRRIAAVWPKIRPLLREAVPSQATEVAHIFHGWIYPNHHFEQAPPEYAEESRRYARQMMSELLDDFADQWWFHHHLRRYAEDLGLGEKIVIDRIAEVMFPSRELSNWRTEEPIRKAAANKLGEEFAKQQPDSVIGLLKTVEEQGRAANISDSSWAGQVCQRLAEESSKPEEWIAALLDGRAPPNMAEPFFKKVATENSSSAQGWISHALEVPELQWLCVSLTLQFYTPESSVWLQASPFFKQFARGIGVCVLRNEVREENIVPLLRSEEPAVAQSVAMNLWRDTSGPRIPDELLGDWKCVIVDCEDEMHDHWLQEIFRKFPDVAYQWIEKRLDDVRDGVRHYWRVSGHDRALQVAIDVLTLDQRKTLIGKLNKSFAVSDLVRLLVGRDLELYRHLLAQEHLEKLRLNPLRLGPYSDEFAYKVDDAWKAMVIVALEKGFSPEQVFWESHGSGGSWSGPTSNMYAAKLAAYEELLNHPDSRLQQIGRLAVEYFSKLRDANLAAEKRAAIRGEVY